MGALLRAGSQNEEGRQDALKRLETDFKKGDVQASIARAQLEMQDDPRKALATLESVDLAKQMVPVADQVRCTRATIHLQLGELQEARALVDKMELGKQQDAKTRAMFAAVAGEAWGRTGQGEEGRRAARALQPRGPRVRRDARADVARAGVRVRRRRGHEGRRRGRCKKLIEVNPQLLGMFVGAKKIHPMLQQEAKQLLMRSGAVPRKMVRQKM